MQAGTIIVLVSDEKVRTVGVVVRVGESTARVCAWTHRKGRWGEPFDISIDGLTLAEADWDETQKAKANIRRHNGVIPYGGAAMTRYIRVWPSGKEPAPE